MKETPILFKGEMVNAILQGRKTQTRRIIKPQPFKCWKLGAEYQGLNALGEHLFYPAGDLDSGFEAAYDEGDDGIRVSPYEMGQRLWVKETFSHSVGEVMMSSDERRPVGSKLGMVAYRASCNITDPPVGNKWKPSIFMPRALSRITLESVSVRVERLQDISEEDAKAEGVTDSYPEEECNSSKPFREGYMRLWEKINGKGSWESNPWVWVVEFKVIEPAPTKPAIYRAGY